MSAVDALWGLLDRLRLRLWRRVEPYWRPIDRWLAVSAAREAVVLWAVCFGGIALAFAFSGLAAKLVATLGFLYLPEVSMRRRGEGFAHYGVSFRAWKQDLKWFAILFGLIAPLFVLGYSGFAELLPSLPPQLRQLLAPGQYSAPHFHFRLPW